MKMIQHLWITFMVLFGCSHCFQIQQRIINGFKATPYQFPSYVYFHTLPIDSKVLKCAGVLISDRWILTAGHCLQAQKSIDVYLGYLSNGNYTGKTTVSSANQHIHNLATSAGDYDIGLIQLAGSLKANSNDAIAPIPLPKDCNEDHLYNEIVILPGTGFTSYTQSESRDKTLKYAICKTLSHQECEEIASKSVDKRSVLFSYSSNGQSTYKGDSGGPAIRQRDNTLIGISSHVFPSSFTYNGKPVIIQGITNIHYFFDWISEITGLELPKC